jgi:tRNA-uridine 2-sulfurtransferase
MQTMPEFRPDFARAGRTLAAMSGGVDSAVATAAAVQSGMDAVGVTMRLWSPGDGELSEKSRQCCGPTAFDDARRAASSIGIPHYVLNFESAFERAVVDYFCAEYLAGRTPNPCVACNNLVKFGALLDFARALGATSIVTGHYARVVHGDDGTHLYRAVDASKDQSYMLAGLRADQLRSLTLPLGEHTKEETRGLARAYGLDVAEKPDSMDLCFVDGDYRSFIARRFPESAANGPMLSLDGREVGRHDGLVNYTVGQRKGLTVSGLGDGPWFVVRTDRDSNAVVVGRREDLAKTIVDCTDANVIRPERFADGRARGRAVCRYRSKAILSMAELTDAGGLRVHLDEPVPMVSPGQSLVLYDDDDVEVLASGIIA